MDLLTEMTLAVADGLQSKSLTNCLRWAAKRRVMTHVDFPGPYSAKHHPWVREMHNSKASFNYAMKGAQLGVTEVLINLAFYTIDQLRRDVLYGLPTMKNAGDFSKARFNTALQNSPYLKSIFTDTNAIEIKQAGNVTLYIRGSRGDSNFKSIPVSVLLLDEIDEMSQRAVNLALTRLDGHISKTVWGISTPTLPNYGIDKLFKNTTQEHFTFKCPCCNRHTELVWPDCIEIIGETINDPRRHESFLKCKECDGKLEHQAKVDWLKDADWTVTNQGADPDMRGFAISQLYSFTVSPGELVTAHFRGLGDEAANIEFHNSKLGIPYIGDGAKITDEDLDGCVKNYTKDDSRPQVGGQRIITMGVDQGTWNYIEVTEWFFDQYSIDLNVAANAKVLYHTKVHEEDFNTVVDEMMREWQILACVIDPDPHPMEARRFARRFPGYVWLCRFRRGPVGKEISVTNDGDYAPIATVDRANWFSAALGRFQEPRRIALPRDVSLEYREHIKSPVRTYVKQGSERSTKDEQKKSQSDNMVLAYISTGPDHYALARVYSEIALPFAASLTSGEDIQKFL